MKKSIFFFSLILLFAACRKDSTNVFVEQEDFTPAIIEIEDPVTATIFGTVKDEANSPLVDAVVYLYGQRTTTNLYGHFVFKNVTMDKAGTFLQVRKEGYFPGSVRYFPEANSENYTKVTLLQETIIGSLESNTGGTVLGDDGIRLVFPSDAIVDANGKKYNGTFNIAAKWIDPTDDDLYEKMPGNLEGRTVENETVALSSFGMMAVKLTSDMGAPLNLGNSKKANLFFPLPTDLVNTAPATIPLWYFDEDKGLWQEEGEPAVLNNGQYVGLVSHFSFWNCDAQVPLVQLTGSLVTEDGVPLINVKVTLERTALGTKRQGFTDNNGVFSGAIPANEELTLYLNDLTGCDVFSIDIGAFSQDTDLGEIEVTSMNLLQINATIINCDNDLITDGLLDVRIGTNTIEYYIGQENPVEFAIFNCPMMNGAIVTATDFNALTLSNETYYSIANNELNITDIAACGNALDDYIKITLDDYVHFGVDIDANRTDNLDTLSIYYQESVNIQLKDVNAPGTYTNDNIVIISAFVESQNSFIEFICFEDETCETIEEIVITEIGTTGQKVKGRIKGTQEFSSGQSTEFEIEFSATLN